MIKRWRLGQLAGSLTLALQSKRLDGGDPLSDSRHCPEFIRRGICKVKNPSPPAVDEFHGANIRMNVLRRSRFLVQELVTLFTGENIVAFVDGFGADHKLWNVTQGAAGCRHYLMARDDVAGIE